MTLSGLAKIVNANDALVRRGRYLTTHFVVGVGDTDWLIEIDRGRIAAVTADPPLMTSAQFTIRAPESAWAAFWQALPRPGFHDIFAMTKSGAAVIEGDFHPFMANLRYFKELLAAPRAAG